LGRIIEYTLISADGVFSNPQFGSFRDDAYFRDGLDVLMACEAMLYGRKTYEGFAKLWPGRDHPWAERLNGIKKYVFSSTLEGADWGNSTIVRGDVVEEGRRLKQLTRGDLLIFGHTQLAEALMRAGLTDLLDLSVHPVFLGAGGLLLRDGLTTSLNLVATKTFSTIVKLSYEVGPRVHASLQH
jgi:dihydrofolate reductase